MVLFHCLLPFLGCFQVEYTPDASSSDSASINQPPYITTSSNVFQSDNCSMQNDSHRRDIIKIRLSMSILLLSSFLFYFFFITVTERSNDSLYEREVEGKKIVCVDAFTNH